MERIKYKHHGVEVTAFRDLVGKHREHCLCYHCKYFHPNSSENCPLAQRNYEFDVANDLLTPVYECGSFEEKEDANGSA